jgi:hypothetical protein
MSVYSKKRETKRLVIETTGDEIIGRLLIPAIRYQKYSESINSAKLDFGDVPTDCEVILAITKKTNNSIEVYLEKFIFKGKSSLPIQFSEYSFSQLNQRINELQIK